MLKLKFKKDETWQVESQIIHILITNTMLANRTSEKHKILIQSIEFNPAAGTGKLKLMKDTKREGCKIRKLLWQTFFFEEWKMNKYYKKYVIKVDQKVKYLFWGKIIMSSEFL